jgi:hypothetical protein
MENRERGLRYFSCVTATIHYLNITENEVPCVTGKYQINSLYSGHYLFKTTATGNLNIYLWKTSFICHKLPTCTFQYMILLVKLGKRERESQSTDLVRLQLWRTHARTRLWNKKVWFLPLNSGKLVFCFRLAPNTQPEELLL